MKLRYLLYLGILASLLASCGASRTGNQKHVNQEITKVINYAYTFRGTPYRSGGTTPKGFDCSGYTQFVFKEFNYKLPRTTNDQSKVGKSIKQKDIRPGDLVFFRGRDKKSKRVGHVGIAVETNRKGEFRFIHASSSRGIVVSDMNETYYKERYLSCRRIIQ